MGVILEFLQLTYFCDAAKTQNFSETAKKFMVPPSDISQSIKRLERELGVELFTRHTNRVILNRTGAAFYEKVSEALKLLDEARASATGTSGGTLNICVNTNRRIVLLAIERMREEYPDVRIITKFGVGPFSDDFDLIISNDTLDAQNFVSEKILSEKVCLAVRRDDQIANSPEICADMLRDRPFITMYEGGDLYKLTVAICKKYGFSPRIAIQSDDPFYVRKCVELGLGVAFVPSISWRGQFSSDIILKEVSGYIRDTYVTYGARRHSSPFAKNFILMLKDECHREDERVD